MIHLIKLDYLYLRIIKTDSLLQALLRCKGHKILYVWDMCVDLIPLYVAKWWPP